MQVLLKGEDEKEDEGLELATGSYTVSRIRGAPEPAGVYLKGPGYETGRLVGADSSVSRDHLSMNILEDRVTLADRGSTNGSKLQGKKLGKEEITSPGIYTVELGVSFAFDLVVR